jgi:hypothetical protein
MLRTNAVPDQAKSAQLAALEAVNDNYTELVASTDPEGWVEGDAAERAEEQLAAFYKADEAYAFSLHALPPAAPEVMLLQCWIVGGGPPIWRAIKRGGSEITDKKDLPKSVLRLLGLKPRRDKKPGTRGKAPSSAAPRPATSPSPQKTPAPPKKK